MDQYQHLIGKTKNNVLNELGDECNFYQSSVWTYILKKEWFGRKKVLIINFDDNKVSHIKTVTTYTKNVYH